MKLKSKLIATIVSICAAIAVMGVGVWAATDDFTVTVTNTVNIAVANLSGKVTVETVAMVDGATAGYTELDPANTGIIFDSKGAETIANDAATIAKAGEHAYAGAELFAEKIGNTTTSASLSYKFTFTPYGTPAGVTNVTINPTTLPNDAATNVMAYSYKVNGGEAQALTQGTAVQLWDAATATITIEIIATYTNAYLVSTVVSGNYEFNVVFATATAGVGSEI